MLFRIAALALLAVPTLTAQTADQVLVVINKKSLASREIGEYYLHKRGVPLRNLCSLDTVPVETIGRPVYEKEIETPIRMFLVKAGLAEKVLYIVLTSGVPLRIQGAQSDTPQAEGASVDSELSLLYKRMKGASTPLSGAVANPFFGQRDIPFRHPLFPLYLVTRLDAYSMTEMKSMVDRALEARNTGVFVIDLRANEETPGNQWLRTAALLLPRDRVVMDESAAVLANVKNVIGYASWGSNDPDRKHRFLHNQWLPGSIATEFVSTDGRTFRQPPETWEIGPWADKQKWFAGAPQTLAADYIHEGASGASGQIDEPYLNYCPRPNFVLPAYFSGRTLAESFYMGIPGLSWMNVVIGDPLMRLK